MAVDYLPIPQPPRLPLLGNIRDIDMEHSLGSMVELAGKYGPIYRLSLGEYSFVIVSSHEYVHEVCDDERFEKTIKGDLESLRPVVHDGLFTSRGEEEENWGIAHRVLMSAFGPLSIRGMFEDMHEIMGQLALKWARQGSSTPIALGEDLTRMTLDTLALCAMSFRFNSFYREDMHPFIDAMYTVLREAGLKTMRPFPNIFYPAADHRFDTNVKLLRSTASEVLQDRRSGSAEFSGPRKDLLAAMTNGVDPKTGRKMTDSSIIDNLITFLVAGHETTAATLSFVVYQLIKNPDVYRKVQIEIDEVIGKGAVRVEHMPKLKYVTAVIREVLRYSAPIGGFTRQAKRDTTIGGRYQVKAGKDIIACLLGKSHFDPAVFGSDADEFKPERMLDENFDRLMKEYPHCWSPFGTGMRACIGRAFSWQEMVLCLAVLMQNFNLVLDDPGYILRYQQTLTRKPKDFKIRAILRDNLTPAQLEARLAGSFSASSDMSSGSEPKSPQVSPRKSNEKVHEKQMAIYYGSNAGTCEFMAQRLAADATSHGFKPTIESLNAAREALPTNIPVVIITASYEGQPPHNAGHFISWVQSLKGQQLSNVSYAVYGCGHADWVGTYHRIPKLIDSTMETLGADRIAPVGLTDAKERDMFSDFESWEDNVLWPAIEKRFDTGSTSTGEGTSSTSGGGFRVAFSSPRASTLRQNVEEALVLDSRALVSGPGRDGSDKRHIELQLPENMRYTTGDYLAVLPHNPKENVVRVMRRFNLAWDEHITISAAGPTTLPMDTSIPVWNLLTSYVELSQTATKKNILVLRDAASGDPDLKRSLDSLAGELYEADVRTKHLSVLDIIERFPSIPVSFDTFIRRLPPMRVRQYSISSSSIASPGIVSLTYSVINAPAKSGFGTQHLGVASSYLASLGAGDRAQISVRSTQGGFRLPSADANIPIICVAAGTGIAPFRAFIQERAAIKAARGDAAATRGSLAPALLFFGCHGPHDDLYRAQFDAWEAEGLVAVYRAYSRSPGSTNGCRHVQDRIHQERSTVAEIWSRDAKVYVCGSRRMADGVKETLLEILTSNSSSSEEDKVKWFESVRNERYATDVFD
ncbi:cytochrome P450 [Xylariales sp. PMI_506]|nr:cytochrome P450 [Xylariales sp. PMI_506]